MKEIKVLWFSFGIFLLLQDLIVILTNVEIAKYLDEIFFAVILFAILLFSASRRKVYFDSFSVIAGVLFLYMLALEILLGQLGARSFIYILYVLKIYFVYVAAQNLGFTSKDLLDQMNLFSTAFLVIGVIGFVNFLLGDSLLSKIGYNTYQRLGVNRLHSILMHPHPMGYLATIFAFYFLLKFLTIDKRPRNLLYFLFSSILLVLTGSRKSMAALAIGFAIIYVIGLRHRLTSATKTSLMVAGLVTMVLVAASAYGYVDNFVNYTKQEYLNNEDAPRIVLYNVAFKILADNFPVGTGVATFASVGSLRPYSEIYYRYGLSEVAGFGEFEDMRFTMDAQWPSIIGELGLIGLLLFIALTGLMAFKILGGLARSRHEVEYFIGLFCAFVFLHAILESFAASTFSELIFLYFSIGIPATFIEYSYTKKEDIS